MECIKCKTEKDDAAFPRILRKDRGNKIYVYRTCLECKREKGKEWRMAKTEKDRRLHDSWAGMKQRCNNPNNPRYKCWGGRGISHCEEWVVFEKFKKDMGHSWKPGLQLDRKNNNGNYCKENCRWATPKEQSTNRRNTRLHKFNNMEMTLTDWAKYLNINKSTLSQRFYTYNWDIEKTLTYNTK
jgi:hypothetical protein